jgi:branched-chain amino acid transport system substrate-binding protein
MHSISRRRCLQVSLAALGTGALGGCMGGGTASLSPMAAQPFAPAAPAPAADTIGTGSVKVALLLPLTGSGQGAVAAQALRNAAELALTEFQRPDLTILVKDDGGTPDGARAAAQAAIADGAELLIGPLFAGTVRAAADVARQAGRPMIAFSTDAAVASRGVYLLSFLAQPEVDRIVDFAASRGRRSFAALVPETVYGSVVEAQFREAAARQGVRVVAIERYPPGQPQAAVQRIASLVTGPSAQADALFLPDNAEGLPAVAQALAQAGFNAQRVKPIGTGVWNDPAVFRIAGLEGGWFAAPDAAGYNAFAGRYRARFGSDPTRIASLAYDAVSLAAALNRQYGSQRFDDATLTNQAGFAGTDGVFRFRADGTSERALAVLEIRGGATTTVGPAPRVLPGTTA